MAADQIVADTEKIAETKKRTVPIAITPRGKSDLSVLHDTHATSIEQWKTLAGMESTAIIGKPGRDPS